MRWLYLDADGFFASCEEAADADAPLIAVNTVAKREGVRSGSSVRDARARCPGSPCARSGSSATSRCTRGWSGPSGGAPRRRGPFRRRALGAACAPRRCTLVIERVKCAVADALTERVPVSVGVAPSAWLAKTAAEAHKPSAAVVWRLADLPAVYADLELEDLPGAGPRICARLRRAGLATVRSIHDAP